MERPVITYHSSFAAFFDAAFFLLFAIVVTSAIDTANNTLKCFCGENHYFEVITSGVVQIGREKL